MDWKRSSPEDAVETTGLEELVTEGRSNRRMDRRPLQPAPRTTTVAIGAIRAPRGHRCRRRWCLTGSLEGAITTACGAIAVRAFSRDRRSLLRGHRHRCARLRGRRRLSRLG
jgi:hypothetical protein